MSPSGKNSADFDDLNTAAAAAAAAAALLGVGVGSGQKNTVTPNGDSPACYQTPESQSKRKTAQPKLSTDKPQSTNPSHPLPI